MRPFINKDYEIIQNLNKEIIDLKKENERLRLEVLNGIREKNILEKSMRETDDLNCKMNQVIFKLKTELQVYKEFFSNNDVKVVLRDGSEVDIDIINTKPIEQA